MMEQRGIGPEQNLSSMQNSIIIIMLLMASSLAQEIPPPISSGDESRTSNILFEPPPPVLINGKEASMLSEDEIKSFLNSKILNIYQDENSTELIKVAPGYAVKIGRAHV